MEKQGKQRFNSRKLATSKMPEEDQVLAKSVDNKSDIDKAIVYDYMNYPTNKKKNAKLSKFAKVKKNVSFKTMVELVTYTENWKMKMIEGKLRTEEEQVGFFYL
ncbi:hypothetical protein KR054_007791 [Drosophila jambulina]|nr:hypothetical protein KR054_007791 [Drosophila jambulina]